MMRYVLLLSGGVNHKYNYSRYACDLAYAKQVLEERWGTVETMFDVIYADGRPIEYLGNKVITKAASLDNVRLRLSEWKKEICPEDELYVIVSNHGGVYNEMGIVNLWGKEYLSLAELVDLTNQISGYKYLILGQCYAGNVLDLQMHNTLVLTANEADKESYARIYKEIIADGNDQYKYEYDEFLYHLISGLHGSYPSGKGLNGGRGKCQDIEEAYEYARANDIWNPEHPDYQALCERIGRYDISEIPQLRYFA